MVSAMVSQRAALSEELEQSIWQYKELQAKEMVRREGRSVGVGVRACVCVCIRVSVCAGVSVRQRRSGVLSYVCV